MNQNEVNGLLQRGKSFDEWFSEHYNEASYNKEHMRFAWNSALESQAQSQTPNQKCKHRSSEVKRVMDFEFNVCNDCGHQQKRN